MGQKRGAKVRAGDGKSLRRGRKPGQGLSSAGQMARGRVIGSLDAERDVLADLLDGVAGELGSAAARSDVTLSRRALRMGGELAGRASRRLKEESAEDLLDVAEDALKKHPAVLIAGLAGVGALAARVILARAE